MSCDLNRVARRWSSEDDRRNFRFGSTRTGSCLHNMWLQMRPEHYARLGNCLRGKIFDFDLRIPAISLLFAVFAGLLVRLTTTGSAPAVKSRPWAMR